MSGVPRQTHPVAARSGRWLTAVAMGTVIAGVAIVGCSPGDATGHDPAARDAAGSDAGPAGLDATVSTQPAIGAVNASPSGVIQASVVDGTISTIALTSSTGTVVTGQLAPDRHSWTANEELGFGKTYSWSGKIVSASGKTRPINGSFTTVTPRKQVAATLNVGDGQSYGIAIPIVLRFNAPVTNRAAVQQTLSVTTSAHTPGSWAWLDNQDVHWRPQGYYVPGTAVSVSAKLYGVEFGPGLYGKNDLTSNFTIGRSQIVKANIQSHDLVVITNGVQTADYPASYGLDSDPGRNTHYGIHVVMSRSQTVLMSNPRYGYSNVVVHWAVRISNNGEFIHAAPWSVGAQGSRNVSHGCANLSTANAIAYYNSILVGDPVEVTGSSVPLGPSDGDYYDWTLTWPQWAALSALPA